MRGEREGEEREREREREGGGGGGGEHEGNVLCSLASILIKSDMYIAPSVP